MTQADGHVWALEHQQAAIKRAFDGVLERGQLAHAYLFTGLPGSGQEALAEYLACGLFCERGPLPCGECRTCRLIQAGAFPGVLTLENQGEKLKIDEIRHIKEELALTSINQGRKVIVLEDAERLTTQAQNSMLKFLEEPYPGVYLFLTTSQPQGLLPTIQSRCQLINLPPIPKKERLVWLKEENLPAKTQELLAELTHDRLSAKNLLADEVFQGQNKAALQWLLYIFTTDARALTMIINTWLPLSKETADIERLLNMLLLFCRDLFYLKYLQLEAETGVQGLLIPAEQKTYQDILQQASEQQLAGLSRALPKAQAMLKANVQVQSVLEYVVLKAWQEKPVS